MIRWVRSEANTRRHTFHPDPDKGPGALLLYALADDFPYDAPSYHFAAPNFSIIENRVCIKKEAVSKVRRSFFIDVFVIFWGSWILLSLSPPCFEPLLF